MFPGLTLSLTCSLVPVLCSRREPVAGSHKNAHITYSAAPFRQCTHSPLRPEIRSTALNKGWIAEEFRLAVMKTALSSSPGGKEAADHPFTNLALIRDFFTGLIEPFHSAPLIPLRRFSPQAGDGHVFHDREGFGINPYPFADPGLSDALSEDIPVKRRCLAHQPGELP